MTDPENSEKPGKAEQRNRHEKEMRFLILGAQRMANAAQARAEQAQEVSRKLIDKYFSLMAQKQQQPQQTSPVLWGIVIASWWALALTTYLLLKHL